MTIITRLLLLNYRGDFMSYILIQPTIATPFSYQLIIGHQFLDINAHLLHLPGGGGGGFTYLRITLCRGGVHYLWKLLKIVCGIQSVSQLGQSRNVGIGPLTTPSFRLKWLSPIWYNSGAINQWNNHPQSDKTVGSSINKTLISNLIQTMGPSVNEIIILNLRQTVRPSINETISLNPIQQCIYQQKKRSSLNWYKHHNHLSKTQSMTSEISNISISSETMYNSWIEKKSKLEIPPYHLQIQP